MNSDLPETPGPAWPRHDPHVAAAVQEALQDGSWGKYAGRWNDQLRQRLAKLHDVEHVRLCCSGTVAVELALKGVGVEPGDEVILGAYDFPGNFRCVEHLGAIPVLLDISASCGCLAAENLESAFSDVTKAILVSHLHGGLASMPEILRIASEHDVAVVEDSCQSPLAVVAGKTSGTWGHVSTLSFGGSKLTTAGRGGAVLTSDAGIFQRMKVYSERGNDAYPLSELQAAAVLPQWDTLNELNARRRGAAARLAKRIEKMKLVRWCGQVEDGENQPSYYKVGLRLDPQIDRAAWIATMRSAGWSIDEGFRGFYRRSKNRCRHVGEFPVAQEAAEHGVVLHHPVLLESAEEIERLAEAIQRSTDASSSV